MNTNVKNNWISIIVTGALFVASSIIFLVFTASDIAKNSDIDISSDVVDNKAVFYSINNGEFEEVTQNATGDFGKDFSDIKIQGELKDSNGNIEFLMENGKIRASYVTQSNVPSNTYSYDCITYDVNKKYSVGSDVGVDEAFQGYVHYKADDESSEISKELCKYLESTSFFNMVMCEDKENVYTTINTADAKRNNYVDGIKNNAIYKFDKETKETKRLVDVNFHQEGLFIEGIACNEKYIYLLINASEKYSIKVYDKESCEELQTKDIDIYVDLDNFAKKITKEYEDKIRKVSNYEIQEKGYNLYANDYGLVIIRKSIIAEIDEQEPKHYGEQGYANVYEKKGIEPFVKEAYTVASFSIADSEIELDNIHLCKTPYMYDYVYYKNGLTYVLTNIYSTESDVLEKIKVTSISNGKIFEEININLNKISTTSGVKDLKYLSVK